MAELNVIGGIRKLNNSNYNTWSTCLKSYLIGQDLWEVVGGAETNRPNNDVNGSIHKWDVKAGKALFIIKTTIEDLLEHLQDIEYPKPAWDTFARLFTKKNDARLQLLEGELMSISQGDMSIPQYFRKVKTVCREIGELDSEAKIGEARMRRIIIHSLKPEYRGFKTAIQGWPTQPILVELENLLAGQEALAKQLAGVSIKKDEEALYANSGKEKNRFNKGSNRRYDKNKQQGNQRRPQERNEFKSDPK